MLFNNDVFEIRLHKNWSVIWSIGTETIVHLLNQYITAICQYSIGDISQKYPLSIKCLYKFSRIAIANYHNLSIQTQGVTGPWRLLGSILPCLFLVCDCLQSLTWRWHNSSFCLWPHTAFSSVCVSVCIFFSYKDIYHWIRAYLNLVWSHLTSAKTISK